MNIIQAILMGIVQGLSEFLPVSSSAHIVFTSAFYKYFTGAVVTSHSPEEVFFDIMLHLGTLVAVLIFFRKEIMAILKALLNGIKTRDFSARDAKLGIYILIGTFFTCIVAYPIKDIVAKMVTSPAIVGVLLVVTGFVLFASEWFSKRFAADFGKSERSETRPCESCVEHPSEYPVPYGSSFADGTSRVEPPIIQEAKTDKITMKSAILIGIAQGLAAFPGFSRSGWTMATGLFNGLDRVSAARYSFLLSIPIILGTSMMYPLLELDPHQMASFHWFAIVVGTIISGLVGYVCIKYFLKFLAKYSLAVFAYYCVIVGAAMALFFKFVA